MNPTRLAIERPLTVLMALLGIVLMGAVSYSHLRVDRLPPITIPFLGVNVAYPQASAQDVEQLVTQPIENAVSGMAGVESISSTSSEGRASVTIQFANGTNIDAAALDVGRRVAAIRRVLWDVPNLSTSRLHPENVEIPAALLQRLIEAVCYAT